MQEPLKLINITDVLEIFRQNFLLLNLTRENYLLLEYLDYLE